MAGHEASDVIATRARWRHPHGLWLAGGGGILVLLAALWIGARESALTLLVWCVCLAIAWWRPCWGMALLPTAVAFGSLAGLSWHGVHVGPTDALVAGFVLAWLTSHLRGHVPWVRLTLVWPATRMDTPRSSPTSIIKLIPRTAAWLRAWWARHPVPMALLATLGAYLLAIAISILVASSPAATLKEVVKWSEVLAVVVLVPWLASTLVQVRVLVWGILLAGLAEALVGYAQWTIGAGAQGPGGASIRIFGTFEQPNPYAAFLNFALPLAVAIVLWSQEPRERWAAGAVAALLVGAEALTASRGAALGLVAAIAVLVVAGWRWERQAVRLLVIGGPVLALAWLVGLIPAGARARVLAQFRLSDVSLSGQVNDANFSTVERLAHWVAGLRMFAAHPLLGVGAGNYNAAYARYAVTGWPEPLGHAHNYYITAAAETGMLGLLAFLAVAGCALLAGWCAVRARITVEMPSPRRRTLHRAVDADVALGLLAVVVAVLVHSLTDDLFVHAMELCFALCLGLLLRLVMGYSTERAPAQADITQTDTLVTED